MALNVLKMHTSLEAAFGPSLCRHPSCPFHAVKKWHCMFRRGRVDVLVFFGRSGPKQAMLVAIAFLEWKYLGLCVLWSLSLPPPILSVSHVKKLYFMFRRGRVDVFVIFGSSGPPA